jgi:hypothetical protein
MDDLRALYLASRHHREQQIIDRSGHKSADEQYNEKGY